MEHLPRLFCYIFAKFGGIRWPFSHFLSQLFQILLLNLIQLCKHKKTKKIGALSV